jgi:hypothetical protein
VDAYGDPVDLRSSSILQKSYVAGAICCREYKTASLPSEVQMQADTDKFFGLYQSTIEMKQRLLLTEPGVIETSSSTKTNNVANPLIGFKPKSADEYRTVLVGRVLVKSRSHELLVKNFGEKCQVTGVTVTTPHPLDLLITSDAGQVLVEAKVVYKGNATSAVRGAIGQLFDYRFHLFPKESPPWMLGLFSESKGDDFVELLESLSIGAAWWSHEGWVFSPLAHTWDLGARTSDES